jgi:hypothetical protein
MAVCLHLLAVMHGDEMGHLSLTQIGTHLKLATEEGLKDNLGSQKS